MKKIFNSKSSCIILTVLIILLVSLGFLHFRINPSYQEYLPLPDRIALGNATRNVALIKVHKSASTTLSNILYRYGVANNLTFLLPRNERLYQFWPNPIRSSNIIKNCKKEFNILNVHTKYDGRKNLIEIMPLSTQTIAILRHPAPQLRSAFNYYGIRQLSKGRSLTFNKFLDAPAKTIKSNQILYGFKDLLWNGMSNDLGLMDKKALPWGLTKNEILSNNNYKKYVYDFLNSVEESIDLMLISEYFDQSMVLLQRFLHWDLEDMAYFSLNKAKDSASIEEFTESEIEQVINWSFIDYLLYVRMSDKFLDKVYTPADDLTKDVVALRSINSHYQEYCIGRAQVDFKLYGANAIIGYTLTAEGRKNEKCKRMASNEMASIKEMRVYMKHICGNRL